MLFCIRQKPPSRLVIRSDGLVQDYDISTAEALEIPQSCPKASLCYGRLHSSDVFSNCVPLTFLFSFLCFVLVIYFLLSDAFKHISYKRGESHELRAICLIFLSTGIQIGFYRCFPVCVFPGETSVFCSVMLSSTYPTNMWGITWIESNLSYLFIYRYSNCVLLVFSSLCSPWRNISILLCDAFKHISYKHVGNHMNWEQFVLSFYLPVFKLRSTGVFRSVFPLEKHQYSALWCFQAHILLLCGEPYELRAALTITMTEHNTAVTSLLTHWSYCSPVLSYQIFRLI